MLIFGITFYKKHPNRYLRNKDTNSLLSLVEKQDPLDLFYLLFNRYHIPVARSIIAQLFSLRRKAKSRWKRSLQIHQQKIARIALPLKTNLI